MAPLALAIALANALESSPTTTTITSTPTSPSTYCSSPLAQTTDALLIIWLCTAILAIPLSLVSITLYFGPNFFTCLSGQHYPSPLIPISVGTGADRSLVAPPRIDGPTRLMKKKAGVRLLIGVGCMLVAMTCFALQGISVAGVQFCSGETGSDNARWAAPWVEWGVLQGGVVGVGCWAAWGLFKHWNKLPARQVKGKERDAEGDSPIDEQKWSPVESLQLMQLRPQLAPIPEIETEEDHELVEAELAALEKRRIEYETPRGNNGECGSGCNSNHSRKASRGSRASKKWERETETELRHTSGSSEGGSSRPPPSIEHSTPPNESQPCQLILPQRPSGSSGSGMEIERSVKVRDFAMEALESNATAHNDSEAADSNPPLTWLPPMPVEEQNDDEANSGSPSLEYNTDYVTW